MSHNARGACLVAAMLAFFAPSSRAQSPDTTRKPVPLAAVAVTATRSERTAFDTPQPVTIIDSATIHERLPHGPIDLFRDVAGLDAGGVGPNQRRPEIRLQRGQRVLLLEDGLRLNNARRQQDFGELPALAGSSVDRVEVVRGPSSVLYGTDAIGGVVNILSAPIPPAGNFGELHGAITYRYGSAGRSSTPDGNLVARFGPLGVRADVAFREAREYLSAKGKFGDIHLTERARVNDSGVRDRSYRLSLGYDLSSTANLFARAEFYAARDAGFGFIDPSKLGPNEPTVQILYPDQDFARYTLGYRAGALATVFANRAEVSAYFQRNERHLAQNIFVPIPPSGSVTTNSFNFTDLATVGGRVELARQLGSSNVLTYGVDAFRDHSDNTDSSRTLIAGFGPPITQTRNTPSIPNAVFRSAGVFAQLESTPFARLTTIIGGRAQDVAAETRQTAGVTTPPRKGSDRTVVWSANGLYRLATDFNFVASLGRGFRAPNLVERFFEGPAPEGGSVQAANPDLVAESSINVDLGIRYRRGPLFAESFAFRNDLHDAIKAVPTGNTVNGQPEFQNQNVGRLRVDGLEILAGASLVRGLQGTVSFTRLLGKNISDPGSPVGDSYASKVVGDLAYRRPGGLFDVGYTLRHQGEQKDVIVGANPIGPVIPAFTVHSARAGVRLPNGVTSSRLRIVVDNIADRLYAESPNASFFRPEPGRNVSLAVVTAF